MADLREIHGKFPLKIEGVDYGNLRYEISTPKKELEIEEKQVRGKKPTVSKKGVKLLRFSITLKANQPKKDDLLLSCAISSLKRLDDFLVTKVNHWTLAPYGIADFVIESFEGLKMNEDGSSEFVLSFAEYIPEEKNKIPVVKKPEINLSASAKEAGSVFNIPNFDGPNIEEMLKK